MAAIDIRNLRPTDVCKLLNSTSAGEVINERQLHRHRVRAGYRIGDGRHVDLFRYVAWLVEERHRPRPETPTDPYDHLKEKARARNAALSLAGRDIGELPEVANPEQKKQAERNFRFFCNSYFPGTFHLPWSSDHLKVIGKVEEAVLNGGLFSMAMPRGTGNPFVCRRRRWKSIPTCWVIGLVMGADDQTGSRSMRTIITKLPQNYDVVVRHAIFRPKKVTWRPVSSARAMVLTRRRHAKSKPH